MTLLQKTLFSACIFTLTACALNDGPDKDIDPYKSFNRKVFRMNMIVDTDIIRPIALAYDKIVPDFIELRIRNIFDNMAQVTVISNDI